MVIVFGDVNSTIACSLAAAKLGIPIAHVESGLRSFDWKMPEEINRVLTDRLSTFLFTTSPEAKDNLINEGISDKQLSRFTAPVGLSMVSNTPEEIAISVAAQLLQNRNNPAN